MNYAIDLLNKEKVLLERLIKEGDFSNHPEALKDRKRKVRDLDNALTSISKTDNKRL